MSTNALHRLNDSKFMINARNMSKIDVKVDCTYKELQHKYLCLRTKFLEKHLEIASLKRRIQLLENQRLKKYR